MQDVDTTKALDVPEEPTTAQPVGTKTVPYTAPKAPSGNFLQALKAALINGDITSTEAAQLRARLGISKRNFTKKKFNFAKVKRKAQLARQARAAQRKRNTLKGAKVSQSR